MKYTYPTSLDNVGSEYIWLWQSISKRLEVIAWYSCTFRLEMPSANEIHLSKFSWPCRFRIYMAMGSLCWSISKRLGVIPWVFLLLQERNTLQKLNILIHFPWVMQVQNIYRSVCLSEKGQKLLLGIPAACEGRRPLEMYFSKFPWSCRFRICMFIGPISKSL